MSRGISVVICCRNSAPRLPKTLQRLVEQTIIGDYPWEVLIVDNASTDDTALIATQCWPTQHPARLRVVSEPTPGTGNARKRGIDEAKYDIVSFVDDDNWVPSDWLLKVDEFFRLHPKITAVGGPTRGAFDAIPPPWFDRVAVSYAVGPQFLTDGDITDRQGTLLWTTGMSLRKAKVQDLFAKGFRFESYSAGQRGEDTELCFGLRALGARLYYDSSMLLEHFVPTDRLTWSYALKHSFNSGENSPVFNLYLMALKVPPYRDYSSVKATWIFQTARTVVALLVLCVLHPTDFLWQPEGAMNALLTQNLLGRLLTLRKLRGKYAQTRERIQNAAWASVSSMRSSIPNLNSQVSHELNVD